MFFWDSLALSVIQLMLAICSLVPLPFLNPAWTSGSSRFTYCWSLDPDNHNGVITHWKPDILEFKVKWTLGRITKNKASGDNGIPAELFQILKDDAVKGRHSICQQNLESSAVATGLEKVSFYSNPKERQCQRLLKLLHNYTCLTH